MEKLDFLFKQRPHNKNRLACSLFPACVRNVHRTNELTWCHKQLKTKVINILYCHTWSSLEDGMSFGNLDKAACWGMKFSRDTCAELSSILQRMLSRRCALIKPQRFTWGQHSTARPSSTLASSSEANSTAAFHNFTLVGSLSRARLNTLLWLCVSFSSSAARIHRRTEVGFWPTPFATMAFASSGFESLANSSHTSSEWGHRSQPFWIILRASASFPATSSCKHKHRLAVFPSTQSVDFPALERMRWQHIFCWANYQKLA